LSRVTFARIKKRLHGMLNPKFRIAIGAFIEIFMLAFPPHDRHIGTPEDDLVQYLAHGPSLSDPAPHAPGTDNEETFLRT